MKEIFIPLLDREKRNAYFEKLLNQASKRIAIAYKKKKSTR